jgi:cation:H+ antiporter
MRDLVAFLLWLLLVAASSIVLEGQLNRLGARLGLSEALQGIVTALAADAPEIATALAALASGNRELGVGVVIGSNAFNLAALLGLAAMVAGEIRVRPRSFALNAIVAAAVTAVATVTILQVISPLAATLALIVVMTPYVALAALRRPQIEALPIFPSARRLALATVDDVKEDERQEPARHASFVDVLSLVPSLASVVIGSIRMVHLAVPLAARVGIPHRIVGTLILAGLTGLPNAIAALRLARRGRGSAVVSEALNSNTINVAVGICLPGLVIGMGPAGLHTGRSIGALAVLTAVALGMIAFRQRLRRLGGAAIIALYLAFALMVVWGG